MKTLSLLLAALVATGSGYAQAVVAPGQAAKTAGATTTPTAPGNSGSAATPATPATPVVVKTPGGIVVPDAATSRATADNAVTLAKGNNVTAAEQALTTLNLSPANTAAWHIETAQHLVQTAEQLARAGQPASVAALTASALAHLDQADALAKDARTRAAGKTLAGFINERYRANPTAALASYQAAVQLSPTTSTAAKAAADHLQANKDNLANKLVKGGKG